MVSAPTDPILNNGTQHRRVVSPTDLSWAAWRLVRKAMFSLPPVGVHLMAAQLRGKAYGLAGGVPDHVIENISSAFQGHYDSADVERIAKRYCAFTKQLYLERVIPMLPCFWERYSWNISGREHIDDALSLGRGVVIATAHLGFPRLIVPLLKACDYEVKQIVAGGRNRMERKEKEGEELVGASRFRKSLHERTRILTDRIGTDEIVAGLDIRPIVRALEQNQAVLVAGDGLRAAELIELPLLERSYPFPAGFVKIAAGSGTPIVPVFAVSSGREILIEIHAPIEIDRNAEVRQNLGKFAAVLSSQLRRTPHLWARWGINDLFNRAIGWAGTELRERHTASRSL